MFFLFDSGCWWSRGIDSEALQGDYSLPSQAVWKVNIIENGSCSGGYRILSEVVPHLILFNKWVVYSNFQAIKVNQYD